MTKEEAKLVLDNARPQTKEIDRQFYDDEDLNNAIDMAINSLEQPTTQEILSHIETGITNTGQSDSYCVGFCNALVWLKSCITHEEPQFFEDGKVSENSTGSTTSDDCVSRTELLKYQQYLQGKMPNEENYKLWKFIKELPPVTSTHKVGKWIKTGGSFRCSECMVMPEFKDIRTLKFCPNCGVDMRGE